MAYLRRKKQLEDILLRTDNIYRHILFGNNDELPGDDCPTSCSRDFMDKILKDFDGIISSDFMNKNLKGCKDNDSEWIDENTDIFGEVFSMYIDRRYDCAYTCRYCQIAHLLYLLDRVHKEETKDQMKELKEWKNLKNTTKEK